jgi:hypothetical protein
MKTPKSHGASLIEVLIVIAIIGLLFQLALPAVQTARESARQTQCKNNLHQLALAGLMHSNTHGHFPTGGWNSAWVGDPERGFGKKQPGGWAYNILPYVEQQELHDLGRGLPEPERRKAAAQLYGTTVPVFVCTSRRSAGPLRFVKTRIIMNADMQELVILNKTALSDYAGNMGSTLPGKNFALGPSSYEEGDSWTEGKNPKKSWIASENNGMIFQRSEVTPAMVTDGLSKTFLLGEKFVPPYYEANKTHANDQSMFVGFSYDNNRAGSTATPPIADSSVQTPSENRKTLWRFGSAHPTGFYMACCDGSVHRIEFDVDAAVFSAMSTRNLGDTDQLTEQAVPAN